MKNISFDNPYLLLLAIPVVLAIIIPFFLVRNKDNKTVLWTISLCTHIAIVICVVLAVAGLATTSTLTKTTVYVVADVSYSSEQNFDKIDEYISEIKENLPEKYSMGVVCFGKDSVVLTPLGRKIKSVSEANVDNSATDIVSALNYTETLFDGESLKRIILITDGNDTINKNSGTIASTVERLSENGVKIDAIFLDNSLKENDNEVQLLETEYLSSTYINHKNEAKFLIQASNKVEVMLELYSRKYVSDGEMGEYEKVTHTVLTAEAGLSTVKVELPSDVADCFEYKAVLVTDDDISEHNNERTFVQTIVGKEKILHITGSQEDKEIIETLYGEKAEIDAYVVFEDNNRVPFLIEELVEYDEIVLSNIDIRDIRNVNALVDTLDVVVSQYGKSLITMGDLRLQSDTDDPIFRKFEELLPVNYGSTNTDGRLYTFVLDVSHSMFMASKFTIAKLAASRLISVLEDEDYVCLVTFSGDIKVQTPKKVKECKQDLIEYIDSLSTSHGTDIGLGLEEALKTIRALNLTDNQIMLISDGFSFESKVSALEVAEDLYDFGTVISAVNPFIPAEGTSGRETLKSIVNVGEGGNYYEISKPEAVEDIVFGTIANDVGQVIIEKEAVVNIAKHNDAITEGFYDIPNVSKFIVSVAKYDASCSLTLTYKKANGYQETVPLYAYRQHGNGKISSFTSSLSDNWTQLWTNENMSSFVGNLFTSNVPTERVEYPFVLNFEKTEYDAYIEIVPSVLDATATTTIKITYPNGRASTKQLSFDSKKYFYTFAIDAEGTYRIDVTYAYEGNTYTAVKTFEVAYLSEYNAFAAFDKFKVYEFMRGNGSVCVDEIPNIENKKEDVTTYKLSFVIPLLVASAVLFVFDVFIRKLRIKKKSSFGEKKARKERANESM